MCIVILQLSWGFTHFDSGRIFEILYFSTSRAEASLVPGLRESGTCLLLLKCKGVPCASYPLVA